MNQQKLSRLLFELSKDSRVSTKEISQLLNISQQTASYTINKLTKEKTVQNYQAIIDPSKLGLMNIIVLLNYQNFDYQTIQTIKKTLKQHPHITRVEDVSQGADLLVEYCVPNLSFFNKQHKELLYEFKKDLRMMETYVVIVKHHYTKNYLHKRATDIDEYVIAGDRDIELLNKRQLRVLQEINKDPRIPITEIAKKLYVDPKTIAKTKKWLEKQKIIRGYSIIINYEQTNIQREHLFINLEEESKEEERKFREYCMQHKNITAMTKTIGPYDLIITSERTEKEKPIITDLRKNFNVKNYFITSADVITKYNFIPEEENT